MTRVIQRVRKSPFVRRFTKTPEGVLCPHFYELVLSNGCPYACAYCYLQLTFRGKTGPTLFTNSWAAVEAALNASQPGVYNTGELGDSLAVCPPLLDSALGFFEDQTDKYLLLVTKSGNIEPLLKRHPSPQVIVSFSVNAALAAERYEHGAPSVSVRLAAARKLRDSGWRVRVRIDPVIVHLGLDRYEDLCKRVKRVAPERVTVGTLRQYPGLHNFSHLAPREGLAPSADGRLRYTEAVRIETYRQLASWLGSEPALCKETFEVWSTLGWEPAGCNCTE
ncbi:MAG: hypothetical protein NT125_08315 [Candidatus Bipolaricaulota bacterium]|nr:hypothetical protein [Candidatus Bipolaricaulota bacterium]